MGRNETPAPTDAEMEILQVLWERGSSTVRDVWDELKSHRKTGYTTVLKQLQVMTEKSLVVRDESHRSHTYQARVSPERTQGRLLRGFIDRAFGGSARKLVMHVLSDQMASDDELKQIDELLTRLEEKR